MKRILFVVIALLVVAIPASAQQKTVSMETALAILKQQGFEVVAQNAEPTPAPTPQATTAPADPRRAAVETLMNNYPQAYNPDGTLGDFRQNLAMRNELHQQRAVEEAYTYQNSRSNYANDFFGGSYYGLAAHNMVQRTIDLDKWGGLKFKKGDEMFMENVEVYACGYRVIQADQANNIWDVVAKTPVNCPTLTYAYDDENGTRWEVDVQELILPLRIQKAKNITLNQAYFERALQRKSRLRYDLIEQPDGSFQKVPRKLEDPKRK